MIFVVCSARGSFIAPLVNRLRSRHRRRFIARHGSRLRDDITRMRYTYSMVHVRTVSPLDTRNIPRRQYGFVLKLSAKSRTSPAPDRLQQLVKHYYPFTFQLRVDTSKPMYNNRVTRSLNKISLFIFLLHFPLFQRAT